ncbi:MAG: hypothetical protein WC006_03450 [Bacilli bacterium]
MQKIRDEFEEYLISLEYSIETPSGNPSTVTDYCRRIEKVCNVEGMSWDSLAKNIEQIVKEYDKGGIKEEAGRKSHNAVINALKRYWDFIDYSQNNK